MRNVVQVESRNLVGLVVAQWEQLVGSLFSSTFSSLSLSISALDPQHAGNFWARLTSLPWVARQLENNGDNQAANKPTDSLAGSLSTRRDDKLSSRVRSRVITSNCG